MGNQTSTTLKNKLKAKDEEIKLLQEITASVSYNLNLDEVLKEIVELVSKTMKADSCLIYLAEDHSLILKASKIPHPKMINRVAMKFGDGITGWAAAKKQAAIINEKAYKDYRFLVVPDLPEDKWEAFVSMPILYKREIVGVINVQHKKKKKYKPEEIKLLETISSQVGGAIVNAKLISETQTLKDALATRKIIERAKGLLMKKQNISEDEAYKIIRKKSMDNKKTMKEVAEAIVLALNL